MRRNIQNSDADFSPTRWPWVFAFSVALAGILLTLLLWRARMAVDRQALENDFRTDVSHLVGRVAHEVQLFTDVLESIRQLHSVSDQITPENFDEFVTKGMAYHKYILRGFGFSQEMGDAMRTILETAAQRDIEPKFVIVESADGATYRPAERKDAYFPLTYQFPSNALGVPIGFDFNSVPSFRDAIQRMAATGEIAFGGKIAAGTAWAGEYYVFAPILYPFVNGNPVAPPGMLIGFSVGIFHPAEILTRVASVSAVPGLRVELIPASPGGDPGSEDSLTREIPIRIADSTWTIRCSAGLDYTVRHGARRSVLVLIAGFGITALLTIELLLMAGRNRRVEKMIQSRTTALQGAKTLLEEEMSRRMRLESEILEISSREKLRVGQDLHDSLGQKLTGAILLSRALLGKMEDRSPEEREEARRINELLKETLAQIRRIARGLAPIELGDEGLAAALRRLAADAAEASGTRCTLRIDDVESMPSGKTALNLYHIAQEAVSNAMRHGKPTEIVITLGGNPHSGILTIADNGSGLPDNADRRLGLGLEIMRYRATMMGGALEIGPRRGGGTVVTCRYGTG